MVLCVLSVSLSKGADEATEMRTWKATSGHTLTGKALEIIKGAVVFERDSGGRLTVPMAKLSVADREFLTKHFRLEEKAMEALKPDEGKPADELPYPLGAVSPEVSAGGKHSYFLYFPKSLRAGEKHPVIFVMSPGGGKPGVAKRYIAGAERNRWIIAVSKQSSNKYANSAEAVSAMYKHVLSTLPVDENRLYSSGFSGGSRMACWLANNQSGLAGVIECGASDPLSSKKQVVYGLCGSNCFNRTDMSNDFKSITNKASILRFFPGMHTWAPSELCDDGITHLNGVFLCKDKSKYPEAYKHYCYQLGELVRESVESNPMRAVMWASFAEKNDIENPHTEQALAQLGGDPKHRLYLKGLKDIRKFAEKNFGESSASSWKSVPAVSAACLREAKKYQGTPWAEVLEKMSKDAKKF